MNLKYKQLESTIKKKYSFKYTPEFTENFKTNIEDGQIIPLIIEVFEKLDWPIVYSDKKSVEAKRKGDWNKLTEKITVTKKASGRIEVHSKTLEGNFIDFGKNSKRTGLFIALFQKLATEYNKNGKLIELETEFEKQINWTDYEIPTELPKPKEFGKPNLPLSIIGGLFIAILFGVLIAFLTVNFTYFIFLYEVGIGIGIGYLFSQVLKKTNYIEFQRIQLIIGVMMITMFITNQLTQYQLIITQNNISKLSFFEFIKMRFENGLTIKNLNTGWIGLILSWIFQIVFSYILAMGKTAGIIANHMIKKIPEKVLEYTIYLFEMGKSESEVRAELAQKGWNKKIDQDNVIQAIVEISGFNQANRE
ncbi:hypothetical protein F7018_16420 [Tenacibaculum aiptasiae]|uniref:Uncharacterized protein n=1 Tax=Tenacibaculum aiptasiae TaxID=426481 RepID=A0A7J5A929_9FLAO|nr:hypothetical protein [Tenacibaculum aiptasiae]KAB1153649.1 hypothetical protein F7018_16420 [Tenacibaculum aiptasiae]